MCESVMYLLAPSPCVQITSLKQDAHSDTLRSMVIPVKSRRKSDVKGSVVLLTESIQLGCVSQDYHPKKSTLREEGKLGSNHTVKFSKGTWHHVKKNRERKGPSQGVVQKCEPQERNACAPKLKERTQEDTLQQERCVLSLGKLCEGRGCSYEWPAVKSHN